MEQSQENADSSKKKSAATTSKNTMLKKVDLATAKLLQQIKDKVNKKSYGRKVRDSDILALGLQLIGPEHIKSLQEASLSEHDRLLMDHEEYQRINGKLTFDQFLGRLRRGVVR